MQCIGHATSTIFFNFENLTTVERRDGAPAVTEPTAGEQGRGASAVSLFRFASNRFFLLVTDADPLIFHFC